MKSKEFIEKLTEAEKYYLNCISDFPCIACYVSGIRGKEGSVQLHHERFSRYFGYEKRATDLQCIPLCFKHHEERHTLGFNKFWSKYANKPENAYLFIYTLWSMCFPKCISGDFNDLTNPESFDSLLVRVVECFNA